VSWVAGFKYFHVTGGNAFALWKADVSCRPAKSIKVTEGLESYHVSSPHRLTLQTAAAELIELSTHNGVENLRGVQRAEASSRDQ
jgi:hypothetical protein